jgi:hypothetical protein
MGYLWDNYGITMGQPRTGEVKMKKSMSYFKENKHKKYQKASGME